MMTTAMTTAMTTTMPAKAMTPKAVAEMMAAAETERNSGPISV